MQQVPDWGFCILILIQGHRSLIHPFSEFWLYILILKEQRTSLSLRSWFGSLENAGGSWLGFGILISIRIWSLVFDIPMNQILALYLDFEGAKNIDVRTSPHLRLWRTPDVPDWGLTSWSWFGYGQLSLIHPWSDFWLSNFILKVQRTSMSFKSSLGALEDAGGSWLGFGIFILIWMLSLVLITPIFQIAQPQAK